MSLKRFSEDFEQITLSAGDKILAQDSETRQVGYTTQGEIVKDVTDRINAVESRLQDIIEHKLINEITFDYQTFIDLEGATLIRQKKDLFIDGRVNFDYEQDIINNIFARIPDNLHRDIVVKLINQYGDYCGEFKIVSNSDDADFYSILFNTNILRVQDERVSWQWTRWDIRYQNYVTINRMMYLNDKEEIYFPSDSNLCVMDNNRLSLSTLFGALYHKDMQSFAGLSFSNFTQSTYLFLYALQIALFPQNDRSTMPSQMHYILDVQTQIGNALLRPSVVRFSFISRLTTRQVTIVRMRWEQVVNSISYPIPTVNIFDVDALLKFTTDGDTYSIELYTDKNNQGTKITPIIENDIY